MILCQTRPPRRVSCVRSEKTGRSGSERWGFSNNAFLEAPEDGEDELPRQEYRKALSFEEEASLLRA